MSKLVLFSFVVLASLVLSVYTVNAQFDYIHQHYGRDYITKEDYIRHMARTNGMAGAPYRYRVLSDYIFSEFASDDAAYYELEAFRFRVIQNFLIFVFGFLYFLSIGLRKYSAIAAFALMTIPLSHAFYESDLSFYTYSQAIFILIGLLLIRKRMLYAAIALTILSAFNREEAVFIPLLILAEDWRNWKYATIGLICFAITYPGIHAAIGPAETYSMGRYRIPPGIGMIIANIENIQTWKGLISCGSIAWVSVLWFNRWPAIVKRYGIVMALWFAVQFWFGSADETRLFIVPIVTVLIPGFCFGFKKYN